MKTTLHEKIKNLSKSERENIKEILDKMLTDNNMTDENLLVQEMMTVSPEKERTIKILSILGSHTTETTPPKDPHSIPLKMSWDKAVEKYHNQEVDLLDFFRFYQQKTTQKTNNKRLKWLKISILSIILISHLLILILNLLSIKINLFVIPSLIVLICGISYWGAHKLLKTTYGNNIFSKSVFFIGTNIKNAKLSNIVTRFYLPSAPLEKNILNIELLQTYWNTPQIRPILIEKIQNQQAFTVDEILFIETFKRK